MFENAKQFASEPQGLARVGLITLSDRFEWDRWRHIGSRGQSPKYLRYHPMVLRKLNQPFPIKLASKNFSDALGTLPVRTLRAAGQQQIELRAAGEVRRWPPKDRRRDGLRQGGGRHAGKTRVRFLKLTVGRGNPDGRH